MENNLSNHNIKIIRFKGGVDVVCNCNYETSNDNNIMEIDTPMMFEIRNTSLIMHHWLPLALMKNKTVKIKTEDVLCVYEPSDEFAEHYNNTVSKIDESINDNKTQSEEENRMMMEALYELEHINESNIH